MIRNKIRDPIVIRKFTPNDVAPCCDIINLAIQTMDGLNERARAFIINKNTPKGIIEDFSSCTALVAVIHDKVAGVGCLKEAEIHRLYIHPEFQGKGIGTALLDILERYAIKKGLRMIHTKASPSSKSFYQELGFHSEEKEILKNGDAIFEFINMKKAIPKI